MVKAYQRYSLADKGTLGVIASSACTDVLWIDGSGAGGGTLALTASLDALILWNLRTGSPVATMRDTDSDAEVSSLAADASGQLVASGYQDGKVRLWDRASWTLRVALDGHRSAIASVVFSSDGQLLASGSHDTDIIVWDTVSESGMFRLRGHKDAVTSLCFIAGEGSGRLVSGSKDSLIKVWEIDGQHCVQTITSHRSEVWSIATDISAQRVVSGGADAELRVWCINSPGTHLADTEPLSFVGSLPKSGRGRVGGLSFCGQGRFLVCQTVDKNVQIFRLRAREEALRRMKRRIKRTKEHVEEANAPDAPDNDAAAAAKTSAAGTQFTCVTSTKRYKY
jgi:U3 small nucleolar RNA-associated protein 12